LTTVQQGGIQTKPSPTVGYCCTKQLIIILISYLFIIRFYSR